MRSAIAFAAIIVVFGIFMPQVLAAVTTFLLTLFNKATAFVNTLPTSPAEIGHVMPLLR